MSSSPHLTARQLALQARASVALHRTGSPLSSQPHLRRSSTQETDDSTSARRRGAPEREYLTRAMRVSPSHPSWSHHMPFNLPLGPLFCLPATCCLQKERMSFFQDAGCKRDIELVGLETLEAKVKQEPDSSSQEEDDDEEDDEDDDDESEEEDDDGEKSDNTGADGGENNQKDGNGDREGEKELPLVMRLRDRGRRGGVDKGDKGDKDKDKPQAQPLERDTPYITRRRSLSPKKTFKQPQPQPPRQELRFGFVSEGRHLKAKGRSPHRKKKATPRLTNAAPVVASLSQAQQPWRTESGRFASMHGVDAGVGAPRPPVAWLPTLTLPIENKRDPKPPVCMVT